MESLNDPAMETLRNIIQFDTQKNQINRRMVEVAVCWMLLVLAWLLVADNEVAVVIAWLNSDEIGRIQPVFAVVTDLLLYPFYSLFLLGLVVGVVRKQAKFRGLALRYLAAQLLGSVLLVRLAKMWVGRGRPGSELPGQFTGEGWTWTLDASLHSMPSGHTADLFTGAVMLALLAPKLWMRLCLLGVASVGGASRIVVGAHWPSDVLVGAVIGGLAAYCVLRLFPLRG